MTGTGTQESPYIVTNWTEFESISGKNSMYIEWDANAENKVVDFNEIKPEGYDSTVQMGRYTTYNGWIFKNFYSRAKSALNFGDAGATISGLNFENFYWQSSSETGYFLNTTANYNNVSTFKNCVFSGQIAVSENNMTFCCDNIECSSVNIAFSSYSAKQIYLSKNNIKNSDIMLDVITDGKFYLSDDSIINSRFSGKISAPAVILGNASSGWNVFSLESETPLTYSGDGISVYNSDFSTASTDSTATFMPCTAEQLKSAEYLHKLGFPIGID